MSVHGVVGFETMGKPARHPVNAASSVSRAMASASAPRTIRPHRRATAAPWIAVSSTRKTMSAILARLRHGPLDDAVHLETKVFQEPEPALVLADLRDGPIQEHQREVLGVRLAEFIDAKERLPDRVNGVNRRTVV